MSQTNIVQIEATAFAGEFNNESVRGDCREMSAAKMHLASIGMLSWVVGVEGKGGIAVHEVKRRIYLQAIALRQLVLLQ